MVYQCHLTKFVIIRPLSSKRASEVAFQLLDIFLLFGAPAILQSDNGSEFTACVIKGLKLMWPQLTMVHGRPRHPQSQGSIERANGDIKDMLISWMSDNNSQDWTVGIKFVQQMKNASYHTGIKRTPYIAMFGTAPKVGLTSSFIAVEIIERLETEDDLRKALSVPPNSVDDMPPPQPDDHLPVFQSDLLPPQPDDHLPVSQSDLPPPQHVEQLPVSQSDNILPLQIDGNLIASQPDDVPPPQPVSQLESICRNILNERKMARECLTDQAERMVKRSCIELQAGNIGDNVALPVPIVDRGRGDPRNILGVIIDKNENDLYTIATRHGILSIKYTRADFTLYSQQLLKDSDINREKHISIREALKSKASDGQGFVKCHCTDLQKKMYEFEM